MSSVNQWRDIIIVSLCNVILRYSVHLFLKKSNNVNEATEQFQVCLFLLPKHFERKKKHQTAK